MLLLLIFSFSFLQSQIKQPSHEMLFGYEKKALYFEAKKDYNEALKLYYQIKTADSLSDLSNRANNKIIYLKKKTFDKLIGKWKLKKKLKNEETDITFTNIIVFTEENVIFIQECNDNEKVMVGKSLPIGSFIKNEYYAFPTIRSGENEVWTLSFREINNEKRLIWKNVVDKNGDTYITVDERGYKRDPAKRKKALEDEIHTYYIKVE